jgi:hypothetical protein
MGVEGIGGEVRPAACTYAEQIQEVVKGVPPNTVGGAEVVDEPPDDRRGEV